MAESLTPTGLYTARPALQALDALSARSPHAANGSGIPANGLRPGSIDQAQFEAALAEANAGRSNNSLAVQQSAVARSARTTPTLTLDQFLALTGNKRQPAAEARNESAGSRDLPPPEMLRLTPRQLAALQDESLRRSASATAEQNTPLPSPSPESGEGGVGASPAAEETSDETGEIEDDNVIILRSYPDKDQRERLHGRKWRVEEDPKSRALFFGEDGKFGWDDFVDLINPLQHIPLVNIAYRNLTGDQISGASKLLGAIPFGPVSVLASVTDLAITSTNGQGMAETAVASIFGGDEPSPASGQQLAELPGGARRGSAR